MSRSAAPKLLYRRPSELSPAQHDQMHALFLQSSDCDRDTFEATLLSNDEVFLCEADGVVRGFGGISYFYPTWQGRTHCLILTVRVVLDPSLRGHNMLQRVGFDRFVRQKLTRPAMPTYWVFNAATYKSYLLLPRNFQTYWPRPEQALPEREQGLLDQLEVSWANPDYDRVSGVVRLPGYRFTEGLVAEEPSALQDPAVAYYASLNPHQARGEGILCLCPLSLLNLATMGRRAMRRLVRPRRARAATLTPGP